MVPPPPPPAAVNWLPDTVIPEPAIAVKKSATVSFLEVLLSSASINAMLSVAVLRTPADKLFKSDPPDIVVNDNCPLPSVTSACPDVPSVIAAGDAVANTGKCPEASGKLIVLSAVGSTA